VEIFKKRGEWSSIEFFLPPKGCFLGGKVIFKTDMKGGFGCF
jgi:hypothetical protein